MYGEFGCLYKQGNVGGGVGFWSCVWCGGGVVAECKDI